MRSHPNKNSNLQVLLYLTLLTLAFLMLEVSFFVQVNSAYVLDFKTIAQKISVPSIIIPDILLFIAKQISLHLVYCFMVWFGAVFLGVLLKLDKDDIFFVALTLWFTGVVASLAANQYWFPNSRYAALSAVIMPSRHIALLLALTFGAIFLLSLFASAISFLIWLTHRSLNSALLFLLVIAASSWTTLSRVNTSAVLPVAFSKPNVFIIGVDSLRPDFLGYFGADEATPFFDDFLNQATVFTEAVTPIARTFPAWSSILTGEFPRKNGIRTNLMKINHVDLSHTLPRLFQEQGYKTIYATDETRFSNINQQFGFDQLITPPIGINDFVIGSFNDFPFSNLILNTALGRWLFPHSYGNRPVFATYDPSSFIQLIAGALNKQQKQPIFMTVHFCLPHMPYLYAAIDGTNLTPSERYAASVIRVDQQVHEFMQLLQRSHLLDKAVVVLLSDHGEALELHGDRITEGDNFYVSDKQHTYTRFYPPSLDDEAVDQSAGHGTDVLGLTQYHSVLAIKLFGMGPQKVGDVTGLAPLNNIKPSVLSLAGLSDDDHQPAILAAAVRGETAQLPLQHFFIESDFSPSAIRSVYPNIHEALLEGLMLYEIDPRTALLTVRDDMEQKIIRSKQYADIFGDWMLALYPQQHHHYDAILINLQTGQWTNNLQSKFASNTPANQMLAELKHFYGEEIAQ